MKNANCYGKKTWWDAKRIVSTLAPIQCGINDGSSRGDWRLPTRDELNALIDIRYTNPALSDTDVTRQWKEGDAFSNVKSGIYWSSTTYDRGYKDMAGIVYFNDGTVGGSEKAGTYYVWPVRGGH
jgi:hypothetical protein